MTFEENPKALKFFKNEMDHLKRLKHFHPVRYTGSYIDPQAFLSETSFHPAEHDYLSDGEASGKKALDPAVLEKHIYNAARAQDVKTFIGEALSLSATPYRLIDKGASLEGRHMGKESKLRPAVVTGELETIEFLLKNHSDVGAQDANGTTPLMLAARNNQVALMSILMAHRAFHNTQDHMRETALLIAVPAGSTDAASLLLGCGAEPIIISSRGSTARSLAQEYGHKAISDLIVKALEDAARVACDPRWLGTLLYITLEALQHDYEVVDYRGVPFIHIMPEPRLLENRTSPFGNCSVSSMMTSSAEVSLKCLQSLTALAISRSNGVAGIH
ncbi:hypothetical protein MMC22_011604 [Lobaria immixta]|nr:hypothetical protein [Lobaria immixta]